MNRCGLKKTIIKISYSDLLVFWIWTMALCFAFEASAQAPTISSFSPLSAAPGTSITITGTGFNDGLYNNIVYFGGVKADVTANSTTSLTVTVPHGAIYAPIQVLNAGTVRSVTSRQFFLPTFSSAMQDLDADDFTLRARGINMPINVRGMAAGDLDLDDNHTTDLVFTS